MAESIFNSFLYNAITNNGGLKLTKIMHPNLSGTGPRGGKPITFTINTGEFKYALLYHRGISYSRHWDTNDNPAGPSGSHTGSYPYNITPIIILADDTESTVSYTSLVDVAFSGSTIQLERTFTVGRMTVSCTGNTIKLSGTFIDITSEMHVKVTIATPTLLVFN